MKSFDFEEISFELNKDFKITFLNYGEVVKISKQGINLELKKKEFAKILCDLISSFNEDA